MKAISDNLIHFIGRAWKSDPMVQLEIFKTIIKEGLKCSDIETHYGFEGKVYNKAVCFTDIPLNFCDEHTSIYGKFGIGFKKSFVKNVGGNPARYFVDYLTAQKSPGVLEGRGLLFGALTLMFKDLLSLRKEIESGKVDGFYNSKGQMILSKAALEVFYSRMIQIFSFDKPIGDLGPARDDSGGIDTYYNEREWKIVPFDQTVMSGSVKKVGEDCYIPFYRNHVRVVIVPDDNTRREVIDFFIQLKGESHKRLIEFGEDVPPVLNYDELKNF